jgi:uncharacterized OB-fold protein
VSGTLADRWFGSPTYEPPRQPGEAPRLFAGRCAQGHLTFPFQEFCPHDLEPLERFELAGTGTLYAFTTVHVAPAAFAVPYVIGYVDLTEGVRAFGQIEAADPSTLRIGMPLEVTSGRIRTDREGPVSGYKFRPPERA